MKNANFELCAYKLCMYTDADVKCDNDNMLAFDKFIDCDTLMTVIYLKKHGVMTVEYGTIYEAEYFYFEAEDKLREHLAEDSTKTIRKAYAKIWNI